MNWPLRQTIPDCVQFSFNPKRDESNLTSFLKLFDAHPSCRQQLRLVFQWHAVPGHVIHEGELAHYKMNYKVYFHNFCHRGCGTRIFDIQSDFVFTVPLLLYMVCLTHDHVYVLDFMLYQRPPPTRGSGFRSCNPLVVVRASSYANSGSSGRCLTIHYPHASGHTRGTLVSRTNILNVAHYDRSCTRLLSDIQMVFR